MSEDKIYFSATILVLAAAGFVVNVSAIVVLSWRAKRRHKSSMFHDLLRLMAVYDSVVVLGCAMLYALPTLWHHYRDKVYPHLLTFLLPLVQTSLMSSVYCTVVMSFERYVRICHLCQLRSSKLITRDNFRYYILAIVIVPVVFYVPKFFEVTTEVGRLVRLQVNCSVAGVPLVSPKMYRFFEAAEVEDFCAEVVVNSTLTSVVANMTKMVLHTHTRILPTKLRQSRVYYKIYCIGLNTTFSTIVPLCSLLFLNIKTVIELQRMLGRDYDSLATMRVPSNNRGHSIWASLSERSRSFSRSRDEPEGVSRPAQMSQSHQWPHTPLRDLPPLSTEASVASHETSNFLALPKSEVSRLGKPSNEARGHHGRDGFVGPRCGELVVEHPDDGGSQTCRPLHHQDPAEAFHAPPMILVSKDPNDLCLQVENEGPLRVPVEVTNASPVAALTFDPAQRKAERRLTRISLCIVWLFIFCHSWKLIPTAYEGLVTDERALGKWPRWLSIVNDLSHTFIVLNSAVNFLIYIVL